MDMTKHADLRRQQRAIPPLLLDILLQFGTNKPSGDGTTKVFFDKTARRRVNTYAGPLAGMLQEHLDLYAVVSSDNKVVTVAHRAERIRRQ